MMTRYILFGLSLLATVSASFAASNHFIYEANISKASGERMSNRNVNATLSIIDKDGNTLYAETHNVTSDANGYMALNVGGGTAVSGDFDAIDWSMPLSLKSQIECSPGASVTAIDKLGASPMAIYASHAGTLVGSSNDESSYWALNVDDNGQLSTTKVSTRVIPIPDGYSRMIFHDEFDGEGLIDSSKWKYEHGYVRNGEKQFYTEARLENCYQADGLLHLVARRDNYLEDGQTHEVTSASIHTRDIMKFTYGRVDVYAKLPVCLGTWPAIWLMPNDEVYGFWPNSGEIDIMENVGFEPEKVYFTAHCYTQNSDHNVYHNNAVIPTLASEFHLYSLVWTEKRIEWWVDGKRKFAIAKNVNRNTWRDWPYCQDFYLILNLAFGGGWGGQKGIDLNALPQDYQIDYVRIFQ